MNDGKYIAHIKDVEIYVGKFEWPDDNDIEGGDIGDNNDNHFDDPDLRSVHSNPEQDLEMPSLYTPEVTNQAEAVEEEKKD